VKNLEQNLKLVTKNEKNKKRWMPKKGHAPRGLSVTWGEKKRGEKGKPAPPYLRAQKGMQNLKGKSRGKGQGRNQGLSENPTSGRK